MGFKPLYDNVLVRRSDSDEVSTGGIIIPATAREKQARGEGVAVGDGVVLDDGSVRPSAVRPGEVVLFEAYAGDEIKVGDEDLIVMRDHNILGVIDQG